MVPQARDGAAKTKGALRGEPCFLFAAQSHAALIQMTCMCVKPPPRADLR